MDKFDTRLIDVSTDDLVDELLSRVDNAIIYVTKTDKDLTKWKRRYKGDRYLCQGLCLDMAHHISSEIDTEGEDLDPDKF